MFEEILEALAGPWGIAALVLFAVPGGRKMVRCTSKAVIKVGLMAVDNAKVMIAEAKAEAGDLMAEVTAERKEHSKHSHA